MNTTDTPQNIHQGRNVKRFREMLGLKQEALAIELGDDWSQKRISLLESKDIIEPELLSKIANVLKVPEEAIKNFDEQAGVSYFNTFNDNSINQGAVYAFNSTFNPIEKIVALYDEKVALLERLLESEKEKVEILKNKG
ncbi:helix-turn-helix transcriptional regulator [Mucilaginibacter sp. CAU 1740]|uniref:helix-turn-helix transcriptional regulator n=1 Tax=Mucilaginibacter sp. CAU 1740 TaxID=3140365 RepID=UPI00325AF370